MSEPLYTAKARVDKVDGLHRRGTLEDGTSMDDAHPSLPLPVDYLVAAASA